MIETIWWIVIIILFITGMAGLIYPVIPSILLIWGGFLIYHFFIDSVLPFSFWITMGIMTLVIFVADYISNLYFVRKYGGSKASQWAAIGGLALGPFVMGPIGLVVIPFVAVIVVELVLQKDIRQASMAALGTFFGFISSTLIKLFIQLFMIGWFIWIII
jgi:hypothetical protein